MNKLKKKNEEIRLSEILAIFKPYLVHMILVGIIFSALSYIYTKTLIKPVYESSATLIVNNLKNDNNTSITNDQITAAKNLATVYSIVIKSDSVMEPTLAFLGSDLSTTELAKKVSVSSVDGTQVIRVSVKDKDPEIAKSIASEIIKVSPKIIVDMTEAGSVKVMSYPQVPTVPVSPNVKTIVVFSAMLGVLIAGSIIFLRFVMDKTFRSAEDIEEVTDIPVIGIIPNINDVMKGGK